MASEPFLLGQHEARIEILVNDMATVKSDVAWIKEHLAEKKGERRAALTIAGSTGGVVVAIIGVIARHFQL